MTARRFRVARFSSFAALVGLVLSLWSCAPQQEEPVLALVNGRAITQLEFDVRWNELSDATRARYEKEGGKRRFLDELITRELLMQEARRQGLDQSDAIRDKTQRYKEQLILDELLKDKLKTKVELSQAELDAYYEKHAHELLAPLKVQVFQMLLPNFSAAKDLETQINKGGDFGKFAQRYSIDNKSKAKGGDLGPYRKDLVIPEVDAVIHQLKPGMVSAPIKTDAGYYLVMITPLDKETIQADLATRERLRQELLADKRRKRFEEVIADIRTNATVRLADASRYITEGTRKN
ncbi:peptidylprolyl isomerase [Nitrospira moscoviensis]|uniref:peptidylprolyl isomerase n=1 Tax=Nitrospira moscoviensis TaxID=42253 RepID=A0A0K2GJH1_NITMO|nr:peptidylprolyl isomerase [Nitrospira moscoviensis]ALA60999.1 putative Peptidylprolyl isomerase, PpiC-type [Nitrospira moscoviensis]